MLETSTKAVQRSRGRAVSSMFCTLCFRIKIYTSIAAGILSVKGIFVLKEQKNLTAEDAEKGNSFLRATSNAISPQRRKGRKGRANLFKKRKLISPQRAQRKTDTCKSERLFTTKTRRAQRKSKTISPQRRRGRRERKVFFKRQRQKNFTAKARRTRRKSEPFQKDKTCLTAEDAEGAEKDGYL